MAEFLLMKLAGAEYPFLEVHHSRRTTARFWRIPRSRACRLRRCFTPVAFEQSAPKV
jgi:hypothetical protein